MGDRETTASLLLRAREEAWNGMLRLENEGRSIDVRLGEGAVVGVPPPEPRRLVSWMVETGRVTEDQVVESRLEAGDDVPLTEALTRSGVMTEEALASAIDDFEISSLGSALGWTEVDWSLMPARDETAGDPAILVRAIRAMPIASRLPRLFPNVVRARKQTESVAGLDPAEAQLWERWPKEAALDEASAAPARRLLLAALLFGWATPVGFDVAPASESEAPAAAMPEPEPEPAEKVARFAPSGRRAAESPVGKVPRAVDSEGEALYQLWERMHKANFYEVLDLPAGAAQSRIKTHFEEQLRRYSVETGGYQARLYRRKLREEVELAFSIIGNPEKRQLHDRLFDPAIPRRIQPSELEQLQLKEKIANIDVEEARTLIRAERFSEAIRLLEQAAAFDPMNVELLWLYASTCQKVPSFRGQALEIVERILRLDETHTAARVELGRYHLSRKAWREAEETFRTALSFDRNSADAARGLELAREHRRS